MLTRRQLIMASGSAGAVALAIGLLPRFAANAQTVVEDTPIETYEVTHTDAEWHALLSDDQFAVLRRGGTELLAAAGPGGRDSHRHLVWRVAQGGSLSSLWRPPGARVH